MYERSSPLLPCRPFCPHRPRSRELYARQVPPRGQRRLSRIAVRRGRIVSAPVERQANLMGGFYGERCVNLACGLGIESRSQGFGCTLHTVSHSMVNGCSNAIPATFSGSYG